MTRQEFTRGINLAAERLNARRAAVYGYVVAGGDWDAQTAEELANLIVECWNEQKALSIPL